MSHGTPSASAPPAHLPQPIHASRRWPWVCCALCLFAGAAHAGETLEQEIAVADREGSWIVIAALIGLIPVIAGCVYGLARMAARQKKLKREDLR